MIYFFFGIKTYIPLYYTVLSRLAGHNRLNKVIWCNLIFSGERSCIGED